MNTRERDNEDFHREDEHDRTLAETHYDKRRHIINWRAIIAGTVATLGIQVLMMYLGSALGLSSFYADRAETFSDASILMPLFYLLFAAIVSAFFGGWICGIFGNFFRRNDAHLHGGLTWALSAVLIALGLGTAAGLANSAVQAGSAKAAVSAAAPGQGKGSQQAGSLAYDRLNDQRFATFVADRARAFASKAEPEAINVSVDSRNQKPDAKYRSVTKGKDIVGDYELTRFVMAQSGMSNDGAKEFLKQEQDAIAQAATDSQRQWEASHANDLAKAETTRRSSAQFAWTMTLLGFISLGVTVAGTYVGWKKGPDFTDDQKRNIQAAPTNK